jgi:hypothetical protein
MMIARTNILPQRCKRTLLVRISLAMPVVVMVPTVLFVAYILRCLMYGYYWGGVYMKNVPLRAGFDNKVEDLRRTAIVATLETPVPAHRNVIWTAPRVRERNALVRIAFPTRLPKDFYRGCGFKDSEGQWGESSCFGLPIGLAQPIQILYTRNLERCCSYQEIVIVDPSPESSPYQLVLAPVPLRENLATTLRYAQERIDEFEETQRKPIIVASGIVEMTVPSVNFRIRYRIGDLLGGAAEARTGSWQGAEARGTIGLELNHPNSTNLNGVPITNTWVSLPLSLWFNKPFLLFVRERGKREPLMVIWLDNNELMSHRPPTWPSILWAFW